MTKRRQQLDKSNPTKRGSETALNSFWVDVFRQRRQESDCKEQGGSIYHKGKRKRGKNSPSLAAACNLVGIPSQKFTVERESFLSETTLFSLQNFFF